MSLKYKLVTWHGESKTVFYIVAYLSEHADLWEVQETYPTLSKAEGRFLHIEEKGTSIDKWLETHLKKYTL